LAESIQGAARGAHRESPVEALDTPELEPRDWEQTSDSSVRPLEVDREQHQHQRPQDRHRDHDSS
jgi:hypothetical protein